MRYYIQGEKEGSIDVFIDRLVGMPDNIHYDGEGQYWIAINTVSHSFIFCITETESFYILFESVESIAIAPINTL